MPKSRIRDEMMPRAEDGDYDAAYCHIHSRQHSGRLIELIRSSIGSAYAY